MRNNQNISIKQQQNRNRDQRRAVMIKFRERLRKKQTKKTQKNKTKGFVHSIRQSLINWPLSRKVAVSRGRFHIIQSIKWHDQVKYISAPKLVEYFANLGWLSRRFNDVWRNNNYLDTKQPSSVDLQDRNRNFVNFGASFSKELVDNVLTYYLLIVNLPFWATSPDSSTLPQCFGDFI